MWHRRFGHIDYISLMLQQSKEMVLGLPRLQLSEHVCSRCAIGKGYMEPFDKDKTWKASQAS